jgi:hypothetical protein
MRCIGLLLFIFLFTFAAAQRKLHLPKGSSLVKVFVKNGRQHTGILKDADQAGLTITSLADPDAIEKFSPEDIHRFEIRKVNSVKRNTLVGAGLGFIAGFAIGWDEYKTGSGTDINQLGHAAGGGLLGAFAGGFIGFITGTASKTFYVLGRTDQYHDVLPRLTRYKPTAPE